MTVRLLLPALLLTAVFASPASANWFSNPAWGINRAISSTPNPTPEDIRTGKKPVLVRDAEGNVVAMIDSESGKMIATAEPSQAAQPKPGSGLKTNVGAPAR
mgnify:CR=1 FL=1